MKQRFTIIAERDGVRACATFDADVEWIPMEKNDVGKTSYFIPVSLYEMQVSDELGSRRMLVETLDRHGFDIKKRP